MSMSSVSVLLLILISAFLLSCALMPLAMRAAWQLRWVARPANDRWHETPVALLGGVVVITVFALVGWICGAPSWLLLGALGLAGVGLLDDVTILRPGTKLLLQIPFAVTATTLVDLPQFFPRSIQIPAVAVWILTLINSFNLVDGLDGLAAGLGIITTGAVTLIAVLHHDQLLSVTALSICGAFGGFLIYNFNPASIYLGDAGSLPAGFVLAVLSLSVARYAAVSNLAIIATPALLMVVPVIDTLVVVVTRVATGHRISHRGLDHCHHRLRKLGLSQARVAFTLWSIGAAGALWALFITLAPGPTIVALLPICALMFGTTALFLANLSFVRETPGLLYGLMPRLGRLVLNVAYRWRIVEFAVDFVVISSAYFGAVLIHEGFHPSALIVARVWTDLPVICVGVYATFILARIYRQMWCYASIQTALRFQFAAGLASLAATVLMTLIGAPVSPPVMVLFAILLFNLLVGTRMSFKILRAIIDRLGSPMRKVLVIGAGPIAESAVQEILRDGGLQSNLIGFVDDDTFKHRMFVGGFPVLGPICDIDRLYRQTGFNEILIAQSDTADEDLAAIQSFAGSHDVTLRRYQIRIDPVPVAIPQNRKGAELERLRTV
jgi:UDP-GlcNAc:undecaprenyl-phosphate/decaprenyl-phosphate GlcNAc-1-phosphate transferase